MRGLRAILAVLRQANDPDGNQPQPGLTRLDALVTGVIAAGLPATIVTTGYASRVLPPAVDLAACRIVQKSLTNAVRHAGTVTATVHIGYGHRELCLRITDTGSGPPPTPTTGSGQGLIGMRERASATGGTLEFGPGRSGGFEVAALRAGASAFVVKDTEPADLIQAVRVVAAGEASLSPSVTHRLIADIAATARPDSATSDYASIGSRTGNARRSPLSAKACRMVRSPAGCS
ncbi:MAG TPA: ATP-binding protein [Pseudonocardiaceae bacterium]|nr:ATP-binding protein [Pseudonocardiaceae bacterium]